MPSFLAPGMRVLNAGAQSGQVPQLYPGEQQSMLSRLGQSGLSGAAYVGGTFDKLFGRRALAGALDFALSGDPYSLREVASILPGSDMIGLTDPTESQSYGQVLRENDILGRNKPGLDWADFVDFGLDVAGDPGTYLSGGLNQFGKAATASGRMLKKAGLLDDAVKRAADAPTWMGPREMMQTKTMRDVVDEGGEFAARDLRAASGTATYNPAGAYDFEQVLRASDNEMLGTGSSWGLPFTGKTKNLSDPLNILGPDRALALSKRMDQMGRGISESGPMLSAKALLEPVYKGFKNKFAQRGMARLGPELQRRVDNITAAHNESMTGVRGEVGGYSPGGLTPQQIDEITSAGTEHDWRPTALENENGLSGKIRDRFAVVKDDSTYEFPQHVQGNAQLEREYAEAALEEHGTGASAYLRGTSASHKHSVRQNVLERKPELANYPEELERTVNAIHSRTEPLRRMTEDMFDEAKRVGFDMTPFRSEFNLYGTQRFVQDPNSGKLTAEIAGATPENVRLATEFSSDKMRNKLWDIPGGITAINRKILSWGKRMQDDAVHVDSPLAGQLAPGQASMPDKFSEDITELFNHNNDLLGTLPRGIQAKQDAIDAAIEDARGWVTRDMMASMQRQMGANEAVSPLHVIRTNRPPPKSLVHDAMNDLYLLNETDTNLWRAYRNPELLMDQMDEDQLVDLVADAKSLFDGDEALKESFKLMEGNSKSFLSHAGKASETMGDNGKFFGTHYFANNLRRVADGMTKVAHGKLAQRLFSHQSVYSSTPLEGHVNLMQALKSMDMLADDAGSVATIRNVTDHIREAGRFGDEKLRAELDTLGGSQWGEELNADLIDLFRNTYVPKGLVDEATGAMSFMKEPKEVSEIMGLFDKVTSLFKAHVTVPFPAFLTRNIQTGLIQQITTKSYDARFGALNPRRYLQPYIDAWKLSEGGTIDGAAEIATMNGRPGLSDEAATEWLRSESGARKVAPPHGTMAEDYTTVRPGQDTPDMNPASRYDPNDLARQIPGNEMTRHDPGTMGVNFFKSEPEDWAPKEILGGVRGVTERSRMLGHSSSPIVRPGEKIAGLSEAVMRNATWIAQMRKGLNAAKAGDLSRAAHVDYSKMTPFTSSVMRRMFPFWQYQSQMLRFQVGLMNESPASLPRQMMRGHKALMPEGTFVPEHVASNTSLPFGPETMDPSGNRRQTFASFDLPHESVLNTAFRPGVDSMDTLQNTMGGWMGMTNPLIKGVAEVASGKQFFTGRNMSELDSPIGRSIQSMTGMEAPPNVPRWVDQAVGMSPVSRYASTAAQMLQPGYIKEPWQKVANMTTGARFTNVNMDASKRAAAREYADKMFANHPGVRQFPVLSVKPGAYENMTPEQQQIARMLRTQQSGGF